MSELLGDNEALAASERRLQVLIANSGELFAIVDPDGAVTYLGGPVRELLGVEAEQLIGTSIFTFVVSDDLKRSADMWQQRLTTTARMEPEVYWTHLPNRGWTCLSVMANNLLDDPDVAGILLTARGVTEREQAERAFRTVIGVNSALVKAATEGDLYSKICQVVVEEGSYHLALISVADPGHPLGVRVMGYGENSVAFFDALSLLAETETFQGPFATALATHQLQVEQDVAALPETLPWRQLALDYGCRSMVALPLIFGDKGYAVLGIYADRPNAFSTDTVALLTGLSEDLMHGIDALRDRVARVTYQARFEGSLKATVKAMAIATELRDPYTAGHQLRVGDLATAIATEMGLAPEAVDSIGIAGSIHDIGKLAVATEILSRPGLLREEEFALIKVHPQAGHDIISGVDFLGPVAEIILQHHERLDGSGYPQGLRGEAILIGARIVAVADVVEAMQSHRPYRPALGLSAATDEIKAHRGTLFDPDVVDACVRVCEINGFAFSL